MKKTIVFTTALFGIASMSLAQAQIGQQNQGVTGRNQINRSQIGQQQQETPQHLQECVRDASADNQFEIQAGQFVAQRAQDPQVKQFCQRLVQDHQRAEQQLQQLCQQARLPVTQQLTPVKQAMLQELQQKQGQDLERHFVFTEVGGHEKDILMAQWQAQNEQNAQLKEYAQQQIPVLEQHLRMATQIAEQWVPQARQAGERLPGQQNQGQGVNGQGQSGVNQGNSGVGAGSSGTTGGTSGTGKTTGR